MPCCTSTEFQSTRLRPRHWSFSSSTADPSVRLARTSAPSQRPESSLSTCHGPCFSPSLLRSCLFLGGRQGFVTLPGKSRVSGPAVGVGKSDTCGPGCLVRLTVSHIRLVQVLTVSLAALVEGKRWPRAGSRRGKLSWPVTTLTLQDIALPFIPAGTLPLWTCFDFRLLYLWIKSLIFQTPQGKSFQALERDNSQRILFCKIKAGEKL